MFPNTTTETDECKSSVSTIEMSVHAYEIVAEGEGPGGTCAAYAQTVKKFGLEVSRSSETANSTPISKVVA